MNAHYRSCRYSCLTSPRLEAFSRAQTMTRNGKASRPMRRSRIDRVLLLLSQGKDIDGLWVGAETEAKLVLPRVEDALRLIKTHDRQRYDRILADLDRIWVRLLPTYVAQFSPPWRACFLDERFVLADTTDAAHIAAAIVHEAAHARLWRYGFGYEEEVRHRVEAVCIRREMAFANKLPDGEHIRELATDALSLSPSYYTNDAKRERHYKGSINALRYIGDNWLSRRLLAFFEWRQARTRKGRESRDNS